MIGEQWIIYWNEYVKNTYIYGAEIYFHQKNDVEFKNYLVPSGTIIHEWYSKTNYQMQRMEPLLPLIDGECSYSIKVNMECDENEECLIRMVYYNRYDSEVGSTIIRDGKGIFRCPLSTYSYRMQLISGGVTHFHFHNVIMKEIIDETVEEN